MSGGEGNGISGKDVGCEMGSVAVVVMVGWISGSSGCGGGKGESMAVVVV